LELKRLLILCPMGCFTPTIHLPSHMHNQFHSDITISGENKCIVGVKQPMGHKISNLFSSKFTPDVNPVIVPGDRLIPNLTAFTDCPYYFEVSIPKASAGAGISIGLVDKFHDMKGRLGASGLSYGYSVFSGCIQSHEIGKAYGMNVTEIARKFSVSWVWVGSKRGHCLLHEGGLCYRNCFPQCEGKILSGCRFGITRFMCYCKFWSYYISLAPRMVLETVSTDGTRN